MSILYKVYCFIDSTTFPTEYVIKIEYSTTSTVNPTTNIDTTTTATTHNDSITSTRQYSIEKTECPSSYALLMALTDFFHELYEQPQSQPQPPFQFQIHTKDLFVYNLMREYLQVWKANNWIMSRGKIVAYVDVLDELYKTLAEYNIIYQMIKM